MKASRQALIQTCLEKTFSPSFLAVIDESHLHAGHAGAATGLSHFKIIITAKAFENKPLLACHRLIYHALGDLMQTDIHALRIEIKK